MANKIRKSKWSAKDLDLMPFMNLMVVLIPVLLVSAEWASITIIDLRLPKGVGVNPDVRETKPPKEETKLMLTAAITDSAITILGADAIMPSIHYMEEHFFVAKDGSYKGVIPFKPEHRKNPPKNPKTGEQLRPQERQEIFLYVCDENHRKILQGYYTKDNELVVNEKYETVSSLKIGQPVYVIRHVINKSTGEKKHFERVKTVVKSMDDFEMKNISIYDVLANKLLYIKERYEGNVSDDKDIIITAENNVIYDKIVQIMDISRLSRFTKISIAKLRG